MLQSRFLKNFDWVVFGLTMALVVIGLLVIWSTSFKATTLSGTTSDVWRQLTFALLGLGALVIAARIDYRTWSKLTPWLYGLMILLLLIVIFTSKAVLGAQRWIDLGFFQFQPSEFAKLVVIIVLAKFFADNYDQLEKPKYLLLSLLYAGIPMLLVMRQPDLGTALVIGAIWTGMALVSRIRKRYIVGLAVLGVAAMPILLSHLHDYQKARLAVFNPYSDPLGAGHNVIQSTITVGSGQMFGRGLAAGSQTQLNFLPQLAQHTDFVFAVLSEKMGFVGGTLLLLLFTALLMRGLMIAHQAQDRFGMFLATGIVSMMLFHVFINVGMNIGIAPVTGIPLPFVSYGGTAMIVSLAAIGLLESVALRRKKLQFEG